MTSWVRDDLYVARSMDTPFSEDSQAYEYGETREEALEALYLLLATQHLADHGL